VKIHTRFQLPDYFRELPNRGDLSFVIGETCNELESFPEARKILLMTQRGLFEAGKCTADFYAKDLWEAYLWIRLLLL